VHAEWLREELGVAPDPEFARLVEQVRSAPVVQHHVPAVAAEDERPAIAVLPFETLGAAEMALGEGVHSGILTRLSTLDGLSVISRTSVRRYRDTDKRPAEIAAELGVRWVLEGDVQASGGRFRVNVRLIEAPSDRNTWAQAHEGRLTAENFFQVQADIAGEIADQVSLQLTPAERRRLQENPTASLEAYRLCTEGRMHLDGRSPESMQRALRCFEEAVAVDPDYAVAWVGIGDALGLLHAYGYVGEDVLPRAGQAIDTALERDPRCAEGHAALGRLLGQRNLAPESLDELRLAISIAPGYAEAHNWLSVGLYVTGDAAGALESASRAVALNPLSAEAVSNLGSCYLFTRRLEQALKELRRARELGGDYASATFYEAITLYELERHPEATALLDGLVVPWVGSGVNTVRALALAAQGEEAIARELLEPIRAAGHGFDEGLVLAALGEREAALETFARTRLGGLHMAVSYWPSVAVRHLFGRIWAPLRDDPRYAQLRHQVDAIYGLAPALPTT
jgi:TolB-like protein/Tfp pilus assembly protein PilF